MSGGDPRIPSSTSGIPFTTTFQEEPTAVQNAENVSQGATQEAPQQPSEGTVQSLQTKDRKPDSSKIAEFNLNGQLQEMMLRGKQFSSTSPPLFSTPQNPTAQKAGGVTVPNNSNPADVKSFQESLNKFRVANGQTPIKENGVADADFKNAVREFQKDSGLQNKDQDGLAGPVTRERLTRMLEIQKLGSTASTVPGHLDRLTKSEGFRSLPLKTQNEVLDRFPQYAKSPGSLDNIRHMTELITQSGFERLPESSQKLMLRTLSKRPADADLAGNLNQLVGSSFERLAEPLQNEILRKIESYGGNRAKIDNLENIITTTAVDQLTPDNQRLVFDTLANRPADTQLADNLQRVVGNVNFRGLDPDTQAAMLRAIPTNNTTFGNIDNMMNIASHRDFANLDPKVKDQVMKNYPFMFENPTQLTSARIDNLMVMASARGFPKVRSEDQEMLLEVLGGRADNQQLAQEFRDLANDARFQTDRRNSRKMIFDVEKRIP